jgi:hypothetical protein
LLFGIVLILSYVLGTWFPYWVLMIMIAVLSFFIGERPLRSFFAAGISLGTVWLGQSLWISIATASPLPDQMAVLMNLKNSNMLWVGTALLGFLIGGFSALTGSFFRKLFMDRVEERYRG